MGVCGRDAPDCGILSPGKRNWVSLVKSPVLSSVPFHICGVLFGWAEMKEQSSVHKFLIQVYTNFIFLFFLKMRRYLSRRHYN